MIGAENTGVANITFAPDNTLPFAYINTGTGVATPFSSIGSRDILCEDDYSNNSYGNGSCANNLWIGSPGVCRVNDSTELARDTSGNAVACGSNINCPAALGPAYCDISALGGYGVDVADNGGNQYTSYEDQLRAAARKGWERFRQLFVNVENLWYAAPDATGVRHEGFLTEAGEGNASLLLGDILDADNDGTYDYGQMQECTSIDRDDGEYCYQSPVVENIALTTGTDLNTLGDVQIASGTGVVLTFDSAADPDQEPVQNISIDWRGRNVQEDFDENGDVATPLIWNGASQDNHVFTGVYTCDPVTDILFWNDATLTCDYRLRIQIEDGWGACNAGISGDGVDDITRAVNAPGACTSYDEYDGVIKVSP